MSGEGRHLAVFLHDLSGGGAQRRTLTLVNALAARGHHVDLVVVRGHGPLLEELSPLVRLRALDPWWSRFQWTRHLKRRWVMASSIFAVVRYLRRERPEVFLSAANHVHRVLPWVWSLTRVRPRLVIRVSNHLSRSALNPLRKPKRLRLWQARRFYPQADAIIAVANEIAADVAHVTGLPRARIVTIYNPVVTPKLQAGMLTPCEHPWFAPDRPPVVLGVGRLVKQKDFPTLLKAFAQVRRTREARLVILGEGKQRPTLETLARELGVAPDVALPGFVANPFSYMARASVFVLSSAWEGLPGVLIEAMACGCPVVSTDCPSGPAEILDGGAYGPLVPVGDAGALAHAILSVLERPPDPERLRARAAMFSVDRAVDHYAEVLFGNL